MHLILKVSLVVFRMYVGFWCNSTFMLCYSILKIAILLHKWDIVKVHSGRTVIRANLGLFNSTKNSKNGRKGNIWKVATFFLSKYYMISEFWVLVPFICSDLLIEKIGGQYGCFNTKK